MITRLVLVHLWPAVPTAPKTIAGTTKSISADSSTMIQLFPPSSNILFPNRSPTTLLTCLPILVDPVKEIRGTFLSFIIVSPMVDPLPITKLKILGTSLSASTSLQIFCTAIAQRVVDEDGFQIVVFPHIAAMKAFQLQTATGKLNALITPVMPRGCHCSYIL